MGCKPSKYSTLSNDMYCNNLYTERSLYDLLVEIYRRKSFDQNVIVKDTFIPNLLNSNDKNENQQKNPQ